MSVLKPGDLCTISSFLLSDDKAIFSPGETVLIHSVTQTVQGSSYVVKSQVDGRLYTVPETVLDPIELGIQKSERRISRLLKPALVATSLLILVAILSLTLLLTVFGSDRTPKTHNTPPAKLANAQEPKAAKAEAKARLVQANAALQKVQNIGIDTSDLGQYILNAQSIFDNAKTKEDYVAPTGSSAYYSDVVINECNARYSAAQASAAQASAAQAKTKQTQTNNTTPETVNQVQTPAPQTSPPITETPTPSGPESHKTVCYECHGTGQILHSETKSCPYCHGTGIGPNGYGTCPYCGGDGCIVLKTYYITCPICHGTGWTRR